MSRRVPHCRDCPGAPAGVPIVFGLPDAELFEAAQRGEVVLGGCLLPEAPPPRWSCPECRNALG